MTALAELIPSLKRELAVPGGFDATFPTSSDEELAGYLADAFGEAQLGSFFPTTALTQDPDDQTWSVDPDLSAAGGALIVIYASMRIIRAQIRNLTSRERYKAGGAEYEIERAATVLKAELDFLKARLQDIIDNANASARASAGIAAVFDNYIARGGYDMRGEISFYPHEFKTG